MNKRFLTIWFRYLKTDWLSIRKPELLQSPFVLSAPDHGRMVITDANVLAEQEGVYPKMVVADAKAIIPALKVFDDKPGLSEKLLNKIAVWFIRYTPVVAIDLPDGIILDITGCAHLWGGEKNYLEHIVDRLKKIGYSVRVGIGDTVGSTWAVTHFGKENTIIEKNGQNPALLDLPVEALRIETETAALLHKLGLKTIGSFISMPRSALRRRFGKNFLQRIDQAVGNVNENIQPIIPVEPYQERLNCLEPISTPGGIEFALEKLLESVCSRLQREQKGLRNAVFTCYRIDNRVEKIEIGTNRPTHNSRHLFKLFELKLERIEPALGIELFVLEAQKIENVSPAQEKIWQSSGGLYDVCVSELLDRIAGKFGPNCIHRYLPDEHYWPERSVKAATSLDEKTATDWRTDKPRPLQLLPIPHPISVTAPIPDYPPMLFRYKGKLHKIIKADGPERIEQEWWLQHGQHRDYYRVEDEEGNRYWLFRLGHYHDRTYQWFIHGFFP